MFMCFFSILNKLRIFYGYVIYYNFFFNSKLAYIIIIISSIKEHLIALKKKQHKNRGQKDNTIA